MYKWENERWDTISLQANYSRNDRRCAEPYMVVPADKGKFHVYIECDGEFVVKHIGGDIDGSWLGNVAYDKSQRGWTVGEYKGCKIENLQNNTIFVPGHPDATMNGKHFDVNRVVEADWFASFHLTCDDDEGGWLLYPPPIQKDSSYNYTVSYGNYTEKYCEWGAISISIDEDDENGNVPNRGVPRRTPTQGKENPLLTETSQRQDSNTLILVDDPENAGSDDVEEGDNLDAPESQEIPDYTGDDPWVNLQNKSTLDPFKDDDRQSARSSLRGTLRPKLPQPQPTRSITSWQPNPDLVEAWNPESYPGYSKEDVAAATIIAGGSIHDGRDMLAKRDKSVLDSRKKWSITSSLSGGTLKASAQSEKLAKLTSSERRMFEQIKKQSGKTRAAEYLEEIIRDR